MRVAICDDNQQDIERIRRYTLRMIDYGLSTLFQTNFFRLFFRYCTGV